MRLNNRGRYAVSAILELVTNRKSRATSLKQIAQQQAISNSYLEQIFRQLREAGLVTSVLGAHGGYRLSRSARSISISDVLIAVDEQLTTKGCKGEGSTCRLERQCNCHKLWTEVDHLFQRALSHISLQDVVDGTITMPEIE
ncbi:MAG: Rrf2 family transcriptional regulator [Mariprofundales bacterium]|nr:Rrf2 family transcriptional regulator [Mariprofundales bacterium]